MFGRCYILDSISEHQQPYQVSKLLLSNDSMFLGYLDDLRWVYRVPDEEFAAEAKVE